MPLYRHYDKELVHIHIPKTGGTSVTKAVETRGGLASFMRKAPAKQCGNVTPQHMDIGHTKMFFDLGQLPVFAVIRDPWHRTVSEYVWRTSQINWKDMNMFVKQNLIDVDHQKQDNHFLPQCEFINEDVKLFKYSNTLDDVAEYVGEHLRFDDFRINTREQRRSVYNPPKMRVLDGEARQIWETLYADDLELYHSL